MNEESTEKPQVLVVDDSRVIRRAAIKMLSDDYQVHEAVDGKDGWQQLQRNDAISVVFTDMQMPEMNGIELLANIRNSEDERLAALPVIMITGIDDTEDAKRMVYDSGATDFITKPFQSIDLLSRARSYASLNRKVAELENDTSHDTVTGLFTAASFEEQVNKAFAFASRHGLQLSIANFEIEGFDEIYIAHGKTVAQKIIAAVGKRLQDEMRTEDVAARIGVARYSILLPLTGESSARVVISRVCESINRLVFNTREEKIQLTLAAGYSVFAVNAHQGFAELMQQADAALQTALESVTGDKVIGFVDERPGQAAATSGEDISEEEISDEEISKAMQYVLNGAYAQVPDHMLQTLADKLAPFLDYVANRSDTALTGTDNA